MIVHDLRTPVAAIKGFSQLVLRQSDVPPKVGRYVASVVDEANHLAALIDDLVLLNRIEQGTVRVQPQTVELDALLATVLARQTWREPSVRLVTSSGAAMPSARCDPYVTERAIANLLRVALKYCHRGESGLIGSRASADGSVIWISTPTFAGDDRFADGSDAEDTGFVASAEDLSPRNLSLYLCAQLMEVQSGQLLGDVSPGGGARFLLLLAASHGHEE
jgi:K+-sensing histidine kinase KdpD